MSGKIRRVAAVVIALAMMADVTLPSAQTIITAAEADPVTVIENNDQQDLTIDTESNETSDGDYLRGDVDLDGKVTQVDATIILRESLLESTGSNSILEELITEEGKKKFPENYIKMAHRNGDVDSSDGGSKFVQTDATFILRALLESNISGESFISDSTWNRNIENIKEENDMASMNALVHIKDDNGNVNDIYPATKIGNVEGLQTALNSKANTSDVTSGLAGKVDKETGKGLSTNDYTTTEKNKLAGIEAQANKTTVDSALSSSSTNPVQNKVVKEALDEQNSSLVSGLATKADASTVSSLSSQVSTNTTDIATQTARIDAIAALPSGSTSGDAELIDIRTKADGTTATNAGGAVREQVLNINTKIDSVAVVSANTLASTSYETGKYYNSNNGQIITATGADQNIYDPITVPAGTYYFKYIYGYFSFYKQKSGNLAKFTSDTSNRWTGSLTFSEETVLYITAHRLYMPNSIMADNQAVIDTGADVKKIKKDALSEIVRKVTQYIDPANVTDGKYYTNNGGTIGTGNGSGNSIIAAINLKAGTYYYKNIYAYFSYIANVGGGLTQLSSDTNPKLSGSFTLQFDQTVYLTIKTENKNISALYNFDNVHVYFVGDMYMIDDSVMSNYNSKQDTVQIHEITVKKDGTGDYTTLKDALSASVGADSNNHYEIKIYSGTYDILEELGGTTFLNSITSSSGNRLGLTVPNYVSIIGVGDVTLAYMPDDSVSNTYTTTDVSPLEIYGNTTIENIKIVAKNCRYCVHDETNNNANYNDSEHVYKKCIFTHQGNKSGTWGSPAAIASGTSSGCQYRYEDCVLSANNWTPWSMHNNENQKTVNVSFDGVSFVGASSEGSIRFGYYKSNTSRNSIFVKNCKATGGIKIRKEASDVESDNVWDLYNFTDIPETIV